MVNTFFFVCGKRDIQNLQKYFKFLELILLTYSHVHKFVSQEKTTIFPSEKMQKFTKFMIMKTTNQTLLQSLRHTSCNILYLFARKWFFTKDFLFNQNDKIIVCRHCHRHSREHARMHACMCYIHANVQFSICVKG